MLSPGAAGAQSRNDSPEPALAVRAAGLGMGYVALTRVKSTVMAEARADLGFVRPRIRLVPGIGYWASALGQSEVDRLADQVLQICERQRREDCAPFDLGEIRLSDLVVNLDGHFLLPSPPVAQAYVGSGLGFHFLNGQGELIDNTFLEDLLDTLVPGINFTAGITSTLLAPLNLYGELKYVLMSDVQHAVVGIGAVWELPAPRPPTAPAGGERD